MRILNISKVSAVPGKGKGAGKKGAGKSKDKSRKSKAPQPFQAIYCGDSDGNVVCIMAFGDEMKEFSCLA